MPSGIDLLDEPVVPKSTGIDLLYSFEWGPKSEPYRPYVEAAEAKYNIPKGLLPNLIQTESNWNPKAKSPAGALGLMQIMPKSHPDVDPYNVQEVIDYATGFLADNYKQLGTWEAATAAYHAGVEGVKRMGMDNLGPKTNAYVEKLKDAKVPGTSQASVTSGLDLLEPPKEQPAEVPAVEPKPEPEPKGFKKWLSAPLKPQSEVPIFSSPERPDLGEYLKSVIEEPEPEDVKGPRREPGIYKDTPSLATKIWRRVTRPSPLKIADATNKLVLAEEAGLRPSDLDPSIKKIISAGFGNSLPGLIIRDFHKVDFDTMSKEALDLMPAEKRALFMASGFAPSLPFMLVGGAVGGATGGPIGAMAGAFGLDHGLRALYTNKIENGEINTFGEFWEGVTKVGTETVKGLITGAVTAKVGKAMPDPVTKLGAESVAMTAVGAALEGRVPEPKEVADTALLLAMFHAGGKAVSKSTVKSYHKQLLDIYKETGLRPSSVVDLLKGNKELDKKFSEGLTADVIEKAQAEVEKIEAIQHELAVKEAIKDLDKDTLIKEEQLRQGEREHLEKRFRPVESTGLKRPTKTQVRKLFGEEEVKAEGKAEPVKVEEPKPPTEERLPLTPEETEAVELFYDRRIKELSEEEVDLFMEDYRAGKYTDVDLLTGGKEPEGVKEVRDENLLSDETYEARKKLYSDPFTQKKMVNNPFGLVEKLKFDVNAWFRGEGERSIEDIRNDLSTLATAADEFKNMKVEGVGYLFDREVDWINWKESVVNAARWARDLDRSKFEPSVKLDLSIRDKHDRYRAIEAMTNTSGGSTSIPVLHNFRHLFTKDEFTTLFEYFQDKGAQDVFDGKATVESVAKDTGIGDLVDYKKKEIKPSGGIKLYSMIPLDKMAKAIYKVARETKNMSKSAFELGRSIFEGDISKEAVEGARALLREDADKLKAEGDFDSWGELKMREQFFNEGVEAAEILAGRGPQEKIESIRKNFGYDIRKGGKLELPGIKLYSGVPEEVFIKSANKVGKYMKKARGMKAFKPVAAAKMLREEFNRSFVDRSGNIRKELLDRLGEDGYRIIQKMYLSKGASSLAASQLKQMQKEVYGGLSVSEKKILDALILADRMIDIASYKTEKQFKHPDGMKPADFVRFKALFNHKSVNEVADLSPARAEKVAKAAEKYFEWMKRPLKDMLENGLISEKEYEALMAHNYRRIKLVDIFDKRYGAKIGKHKRTVYDSGVESLSRGRGTDVYEPSSEVMALEVFNRAYGRILNNEANLELLKLAKANKENPFVRTKESKSDAIPSGWTRLFLYEKGERKSVWISPEMSKEWIISDPEMKYRTSQVIRWLSGSAVLRTFATGIDWGFALANLPRDIMHSWFAARVFENGEWKSLYSSNLPIYGLQMGRDLSTVFFDAAARKGRYLDYMGEGGGMEFLVHQGRLFQRGKHLEGKLDPVFNFLGYLGETTEIMTRLAIRDRVIRRRAKEYGISVEEARKRKDITTEATFAARDYMDFGQGGGVAKALDNAFPYLNASIQGTRGMFRAIKDNKIEATWKIAQFGLLTTGLYIGMKSMTPETSKALQGDPAMSNNLCVPLGDWTGFEDEHGQMRYLYFKIPLDPSQKFFKTFFEASTDQWLGNEVDYDRVVQSLQEQSPASVSELPPAASGTIGYMQNRDFWKHRDIVREAFKYPQSKEEFTPGQTPEFYIDLGEKTGLSPERVKYLVEELITSGSLWPYLLGKGYDAALGDLPKRQKEMHLAEAISKVPIIKRFIGLTNPYNQFKKVIDEAEESHALKRFVENRELDARVEGYLFTGAYDKVDVVDYMKQFDKETYDRMKGDFKFQEITRDLSNRSFWLRLRRLAPEPRAEVYLARKEKASPSDLDQIADEEVIVRRAGGVFTDEFREEVMRRGGVR